METRAVKTGTSQQTYTSTRVTNPLRTEIDNSSVKKFAVNPRLVFDKIAFVLLTAGAVWAFYTALASLIL